MSNVLSDYFFKKLGFGIWGIYMYYLSCICNAIETNGVRVTKSLSFLFSSAYCNFLPSGKIGFTVRGMYFFLLLYVLVEYVSHNHFASIY